MLGWHDTRLLKDVLPAKEARAIEKALGYTTAGELLRHNVRKYSHHGSGVDLGAAEEGDLVTVVGEVVQATKSYTRTGKMLYKIIVAGDATSRGSFLNDLAANIGQLAFDYLDAPVGVLGSRNWITPAHELEEAFFPQPGWFLDMIHERIQPLKDYIPGENFTDGEMINRGKKGI